MLHESVTLVTWGLNPFQSILSFCLVVIPPTVGTMALHTVTLALFVTALTSVLAQEYFENRRLNRKPKDVLHSKRLHDGQGKETSEYIGPQLPVLVTHSM